MLRHALQDDCFDAIMVSYQIAHCSAEEELLPLALAKDVGVVGMVAARNLVPRSAAERMKLFSAALGSLVSAPPRPRSVAIRLLGALSSLRPTGPGGAISVAREGREGRLVLPTAGYTFALSHPAVTTVLSGTTDPVHLQQNVEAALAPTLTRGEIDRLRKLLE
jgi:aryl-alcohol dehydrogenase-like predicted oxidoreductase